MRIWTAIISPLVGAAFVAGAAHSALAADDWSVAQMSGKVSITLTGAQPVALTKGEVLPAGGILSTGPNSRAYLVRDQETMTVEANSAIAIPTGSTDRQFTTILENAGVVDFSVDHQNVQHFAVETPYLAAVVKGTEFSVSVDPAGATVKVTRGMVETTALSSGHVILLQVGQTATVQPDGTLLLYGTGPNPKVLQGAPRSPIVGLKFAATGPAPRVGGGILGALFGNQGGSSDANAAGNGNTTGNGASGSPSSGGIGIQADLGGGGASVDASAGSISLAASLSDDGATVDASAGSVSADASAGGGGVSVDASAGGVDVGASVGGGGVDINVGGLDVGIGGGGLDIGLGR